MHRLALPLLIGLVACTGNDNASRVPLGSNPAEGTTPGAPVTLPEGLTPLAASQLDSGNVAYRLKQYPQALVFYRRAAATVPQHSAPWYGVYMVGAATGNRALADSALKAVAARSGGSDLLDTGVAMSHAAGKPAPATAAALPKGHPSLANMKQ